MRRTASLAAALVTAGLGAGGAASCSSDEAPNRLSDGGALEDGSPGGGASPSSGGAGPSSGGAGPSSGGKAGGATSGGRAGSATGGKAGTAGAAGAPGAGGKGGRGGVGTGGSCAKGACSDAGMEPGTTCTDTPPARLCVRGTVVANGEEIKVGDKVMVQVQPRGCFSSSCTAVRTSTCSVTAPNQHVVDAHFCIGNTGNTGSGCTADCSGGGFASCSASAPLTQGQHTFTLGGSSVTLSVPGLVPFGGECIGSPF
jgi:hypothetical protein